MSNPKRWTIVTLRRYASRSGKLAWTYDKNEAESWPSVIPGATVVDADEFVEEFNKEAAND